MGTLLGLGQPRFPLQPFLEGRVHVLPHADREILAILQKLLIFEFLHLDDPHRQNVDALVSFH
jgi:hypothetical protein